jgi:hypothetical protein
MNIGKIIINNGPAGSPPPKVVFMHEIRGEDGKTDEERNMEKRHNIPIGSLVEVKLGEWHGEGACEKTIARLWVVAHDRDCDGTPLYSLCHEPLFRMNTRNEHVAYVGTDNAWGMEGLLKNEMSVKMIHNVRTGIGEEALKVIEVTEEIRRGEGALQWEEGEEEL